MTASNGGRKKDREAKLREAGSERERQKGRLAWVSRSSDK